MVLYISRPVFVSLYDFEIKLITSYIRYILQHIYMILYDILIYIYMITNIYIYIISNIYEYPGLVSFVPCFLGWPFLSWLDPGSSALLAIWSTVLSNGPSYLPLKGFRSVITVTKLPRLTKLISLTTMTRTFRLTWVQTPAVSLLVLRNDTTPVSYFHYSVFTQITQGKLIKYPILSDTELWFALNNPI